MAGDQLSRFDVRLKGTLVGVGATFSLRNNQFVVTKLVSDAPAKAAGLMKGDVLERVDGVSTVNMPLREVTRRIRGPMDTVVELLHGILKPNFLTPQYHLTERSE